MGKKTTLVTGAGGFIGHHLLKRLVAEGNYVLWRRHQSEFEPSPAHEFLLLDLRTYENCVEATRGVDDVYHLAADMGGSDTLRPRTPVSL